MSKELERVTVDKIMIKRDLEDVEYKYKLRVNEANLNIYFKDYGYSFRKVPDEDEIYECDYDILEEYVLFGSDGLRKEEFMIYKGKYVIAQLFQIDVV